MSTLMSVFFSMYFVHHYYYNTTAPANSNHRGPRQPAVPIQRTWSLPQPMSTHLGLNFFLFPCLGCLKSPDGSVWNTIWLFGLLFAFPCIMSLAGNRHASGHVNIVLVNWNAAMISSTCSMIYCSVFIVVISNPHPIKTSNLRSAPILTLHWYSNPRNDPSDTTT